MDSFVFHATAFLANLVLFTLQTVGLDYHIIHKQGDVYYFLVFLDALVLIAILLTISGRSISRSSSVINLLNGINVVIKMIIIGKEERLARSVMIHGNISLLTVFFLTPMFVGVLGVRAAASTFKLSYEVVTPESFTGLETITRVVADQFDVLFLFHYDTSSMNQMAGDLYTVCLTFLGIVFVLHSFSLPSLILWDDSKHQGLIGQNARLDLIMTAKHCALVSLLVVDIPLMIIRLVIWQRTPDIGLNPFIFKNMLAVIASCISLHRTQLLEKGTAAYGTSLGVLTDDESNPDILLNENDLTTDDIQEPLNKDESADPVEGRGPLLNRIVKDITSVRKLPVTGFSLLLRVRAFLRMSLGLSLASSSTAMLLDSGVRYSISRSMLISLPTMLCTLTPCAIVLAAVFATNELFKPYEVMCQTGPCLIIYGVIGGVTIIHFLFFIWNAPFFSTLAQSVYIAVQNLSFFFFISNLVYSEVYAATISTKTIVIRMEALPILLFLVPSCLSMIYSLLPMYNACLGRSHLLYKKRVPKGAIDRDFLSQSLYAQSDDVLDESQYADVYTVSTLGCIVYASCRDHIAPAPLNELLIGGNLIKALRCTDNLNMSNYFRLYYKIFTRGTCMFAFFSYIQASVYLLDIFLHLWYTTDSQTIRMLAIRRYEIKALFQKLIQGDFQETEDDRENKYVLLRQVSKYFELEGFFTTNLSICPPGLI